MADSIFTIDKFNGGLNTKFAPTLLDPSESPDALNVYSEDFVSIETRKGSKVLNTQAIATASVDTIFTFNRDSGNQTMLAFCNGNGYYLSGTTFVTIPSAQSVFTAGTRLSCFQYQDRAYFRNGTVQYCYDGTTFVKMGISAPSGTLAATSGAVGNLNGQYLWKWTYVNSAGVESNPNSAMVTTTINTGQASITGWQTGVASYGIASYKLYRTVASGTAYKLVGTVSAGVASYTDNTADSALGAAIPSTNAPPPVASKYHITYKDRAFFSGDSTNPHLVYYSEIAAPGNVLTASSFRFGYDDEAVTGLVAMQGKILVPKIRSIWLLCIDDIDIPSSWCIEKTPAAFGSESAFLLVPYNSVILALNRYGFVAVGPQGVAPVTGGIPGEAVRSDLISLKIESIILGLNSAQLDKASGLNFQNRRLWLSVPDTGASNNNLVLAFDFNKVSNDGAWWKMSGLNVTNFAIYNNLLYGGSSNSDGYVVQLDVASTYNDQGSAINSYWFSKFIEGNGAAEQHQHKDFRRCYTIASATTALTLAMPYNVDRVSGTAGREYLNLDPGAALWGQATFGYTPITAGHTQLNVRTDLPPTSGKSFQFGFSNSSVTNRAFRILENQLIYTPRGLR